MGVRNDFLQMALEMAEQSVAEGGGPFAALVVRDGKVVGRGANRVTLHNDPTAHAEIQAIRDACRNLGDYRLNGCELYVSCAPCPMCLSAAYWAHLDAVWYAATAEAAAEAGFDDRYIAEQLRVEERLRDLPAHRIEIDGETGPFRAWRDKADKLEY